VLRIARIAAAIIGQIETGMMIPDDAVGGVFA
jgi:hypothetical protein